MRADLIPAIQESIANDPDFNMNDWRHCIAAHAIRVASRYPMNLALLAFQSCTSRIAMNILEVDQFEAFVLFHKDNWPAPFCNATPLDRQAAIARLGLLKPKPQPEIEEVEALQEKELVCV